MKKIILIQLLCLLSSCNGQDKKTEVKNEQIKAEKSLISNDLMKIRKAENIFIPTAWEIR